MSIFEHQTKGRFDVSKLQKQAIRQQLQENILQLAYNRYFLRVQTPGLETILKRYGRGKVGSIRIAGESYNVKVTRRMELILTHS